MENRFSLICREGKPLRIPCPWKSVQDTFGHWHVELNGILLTFKRSPALINRWLMWPFDSLLVNCCLLELICSRRRTALVQQYPIRYFLFCFWEAIHGFLDCEESTRLRFYTVILNFLLVHCQEESVFPITETILCEVSMAAPI